MKRLIAKIIPVVLLCGLIICCPSLTKTASASAAKTVSNFYIDGYVVDNTFYESNYTALTDKSSFPMLLETHQMGYGSTIFKLDGGQLSSSEYTEMQREPIYDSSSRVVVGWNIVWRINPNSSDLYKGTHKLEAKCIGIGGNIISDRISFQIRN